jgi:hypothetical protein
VCCCEASRGFDSAIQSVPFAINPGTPEQKIEPTSNTSIAAAPLFLTSNDPLGGTGDSSDDDAVPLDMGDDVSGDDGVDDDDEIEPLDVSGDFATEPHALATAAGAALLPVTVSPTFSPTRDRRTSTGSAGRSSNGLRSGASHASGSSQDSPAVALECEDDIEGEETVDEYQSEAEALSDGESDGTQDLPLKPNDAVAAQESWVFAGISRRSCFDARNQTRWVLSVVCDNVVMILQFECIAAIVMIAVVHVNFGHYHLNVCRFWFFPA